MKKRKTRLANFSKFTVVTISVKGSTQVYWVIQSKFSTIYYSSSSSFMPMLIHVAYHLVHLTQPFLSRHDEY